jgi:hypothetical protein
MDVSQTYGPPRPVAGMVLPFYYIILNIASNKYNSFTEGGMSTENVRELIISILTDLPVDLFKLSFGTSLPSYTFDLNR